MIHLYTRVNTASPFLPTFQHLLNYDKTNEGDNDKTHHVFHFLILPYEIKYPSFIFSNWYFIG